MASRIVWPVLLLGGTLLLGCTEATPNACQKSADCTGGKVCDSVRGVCVAPDAAMGSVDGARDLPGVADVPDLRDVSVAIEASVTADAPSADAPYANESGTAVDGPPPEDKRDAIISIDTATVIDLAMPPDLRVPDAPGTCGVNSDCTDPTKSFCVAGVCVGCQVGLDGGSTNVCVAPTAVCDSLSGRCVGCTADGHCTSAASPICNKTSNTCAACTLDAQCKSKNAALPACQADGRCVQCTSNASCGGATPVCDTATNTCVQCTSAANCSGATPVCGSNNKCQACSGDGDCSALNDPARSACAASGACVQCTASNSTQCTGTTALCNTTNNKCVQCLTNTSCSGNTPICATTTNTCRGCTAASDCVTLGIAGHLACGSAGACVQCTDNTTCSGVTPICATSTNTCRACAADSECSAIGPGVCMSQSDGHCATDAETVYVGTLASATCSESNAGTAQAPVCSLQSGVGLAKSSSGSKPVVAVRGTLTPASTNIAVTSPLTIVGKNSAVLTPAATGADAIDITSGEIYLRSLSIQGTASPKTGIGINASPTGGSSVTLHMDTCTVSNNPGGGILLNGAAFDIKDTTISGNGAGLTSGYTWGGILVQNLPPAGSITSLNQVTIKTNAALGLDCPGTIQIQGSGVLATGNTTADISGCGFISCTPALDGGTGCGAP